MLILQYALFFKLLYQSVIFEKNSLWPWNIALFIFPWYCLHHKILLVREWEYMTLMAINRHKYFRKIQWLVPKIWSKSYCKYVANFKLLCTKINIIEKYDMLTDMWKSVVYIDTFQVLMGTNVVYIDWYIPRAHGNEVGSV